MKIGIIGNGSVGSSLAALLKASGKHDVVVGSRSAETKSIEAASHGDVVLLAIHFHALKDALPSLQEVLKGKIVVDATNPLNSDWSPMPLGEDNSAAEEVAKLLPDSIIVKAFNTIFADMMTAKTTQGVTAFVASDDETAMKTIAELATDCGFEAVTLNKLTSARYLEAMAHLNIELAVGQGGGTGAFFAYKRVDKTTTFAE